MTQAFVTLDTGVRLAYVEQGPAILVEETCDVDRGDPRRHGRRASRSRVEPAGPGPA